MKRLLIPALSLFAVCLAASLLLAAVNSLTETRIAQEREKKSQSGRLSVMPQAVSFEECGGYVAAFDADGEQTGMIFVTKTAGYGGEIEVMTGISDGRVTGVLLLSHSETPGLGARTAEPEFLGRFTGGDGFTVNDSIDAVTGATISSSAVTRAVNDAIEIYKNINSSAEEEGEK